MGWNSSVALIANKSVEDVLKAIPDVFTVTKRKIGWEAASSSALYPNAAVGEIPGWVAVWTSNTQLVMFEEFLKEVTRGGGRAVVCLQSSVSTIHGFIVYGNGTHRRTLVRENFEAVTDEGNPLPEEKGLSWNDDEGTVFEIMRRLTGVTVAHEDTWTGVRFRVVEAP